MTESLHASLVPSTSNGRVRLLYIDLLRIVSMLMVFFHHIRAEIAPAKSWPPGFMNLGWGTLGFYIFILLSGFSLYLTANDQLSYYQFLKKRLLKIMIPYWVYFWVLFVIRIFEGSINYKTINYKFLAISLTGLDTFVNPFYRISGYCVTDWFLGFIVLVYLVSPFVFQLYQKYNGKLLVVFFIISSLILTLYHHRLVERLPFVQLFTFLLGIFIADITYRHVDLLKVRITFWSMFCGFIAISLLPGGAVYSLWLRTICFAVFCVYVFKFIEENFIIIFKNSAVKTVISFGAQISFMFFLCHHQIIINFNRYCMSRKFQCLHQPVVIAVFLLIVTILVSWLLHRFAQFFIARIQFETLGEKINYSSTNLGNS
jgi:peptidoglycan/LPS O-acetylase OafA/YrhL